MLIIIAHSDCDELDTQQLVWWSHSDGQISSSTCLGLELSMEYIEYISGHFHGESSRTYTTLSGSNTIARAEGPVWLQRERDRSSKTISCFMITDPVWLTNSLNSLLPCLSRPDDSVFKPWTSKCFPLQVAHWGCNLPHNSYLSITVLIFIVHSYV